MGEEDQERERVNDCWSEGPPQVSSCPGRSFPKSRRQLFTSDLDSLEYLQCLFLAYLEWCMLVRVFVFTTPNVGKIRVFTFNRGSRRWKQREGRGQTWDFADSIFTHQTELFPVSTWQNSRSHHLILSFSVLLCPPPLTPFQHVELEPHLLSVSKASCRCRPSVRVPPLSLFARPLSQTHGRPNRRKGAIHPSTERLNHPS